MHLRQNISLTLWHTSGVHPINCDYSYKADQEHRVTTIERTHNEYQIKTLKTVPKTNSQQEPLKLVHLPKGKYCVYARMAYMLAI